MKAKFIVKIQVFNGDHSDSSHFLNALSYVAIFNKPCRVFVEQKYKSAFLAYVIYQNWSLGLESVLKPSIGGVIHVF